MRDDKDRGGKWMIEHHGDGLLRLAGATGFRAWRAVQPEVVQPRQLPDGLLEVSFPDRETPDLFVVEIATYPERRAEEQALRDAVLVYLDRRALPEMITLVLHPKGAFRLTGRERLECRLGVTRVAWDWHVIELWTLPARDLLATGDVGLVPWATPARFDGPPEALIQECQVRIEQLARPEEKANLYAVSRVMTRRRYNDPRLLGLLGGSRAMIESPLIQELMAGRSQKHILRLLTSRFGGVPVEIATALKTVQEEEKLDNLIDWAARRPDLDAFCARLSA